MLSSGAERWGTSEHFGIWVLIPTFFGAWLACIEKGPARSLSPLFAGRTVVWGLDSLSNPLTPTLSAL